MTCKWLITMVIVSPLRIGLWDPFQMVVSWLLNGGDPNHVQTGMILQVRALRGGYQLGFPCCSSHGLCDS